MLEELVQGDVRHSVALELDLDAHARPVGVILQVGDLGEDLVLDEVGDLGDDAVVAALLDPVRKLGDDHRRLAAAQLLDVGPRAHDDPAAAGPIGVADPRAADDVGARREIRALHVLHEVVHVRVGLVDQLHDRVDDLREPVRRNVRRHPDRDARRAVHEQVRKAARKRQRLAPRLVVVGDVVDGVGVDVAQHLRGDAREPGLRVPHRGG